MVVQQLATIQRQRLQLLKRINPKNIPVLRFQRDVLMIHNDVLDAIEQQLNRAFHLRIGHDRASVNTA